MSQEYLQNPNPNANNMPPQYQPPIQPADPQPPMQPADHQPPKRDNRVVVLLCVIIVLIIAAAVAVALVLKSNLKDDEMKEVKGNSAKTTQTTQLTTEEGQGTDKEDPSGVSEGCPFCGSVNIESVLSDHEYEYCNDCGATWLFDGGATPQPGQNQGNGDSLDGLLGDTSPDGGDTPQPDPNQGGAEGETPAETQKRLTKDEFIKLFNEETAKAANGTYKVKRSGTFVKPIDVGSATNALNSIIKGVDANADLNSVVGGFIGIKSAPIEGTATNGKYEGFEAKYALKATSLTAADIIDFAVSPDGTQYAFQIGNVSNPDANSALAHVTNDYITFAEVNKGISDSVGSAVKVEESTSTANYKKIAFVVKVVDGKITKITYYYTLAANLKIKLAVVSATGTCEADIKGEYTNIKY